MKLRHGIAALAVAATLAAGSAGVVRSQVAVRIINGRPTIEEDGSGGAKTAKKDLVEAIPPTPAEAKRIDELIRQLGNPRLVLRDRAMSELAGFEAKALTQVKKAEDDDDDEIAARCALLEEVIQSRQGALFLAARRLNISIDELNNYLKAQDITPLLGILRSRAQSGLVPLWSRVFARLARRPQLYPAAEVCRDIEGTGGYGRALVGAASAPEARNGAGNLLTLMALLPPGDPADTIETLTRLRYLIGESRGTESALYWAGQFRGVYPAKACLSARKGHPEPSAKDEPEADKLRLALALTMTDRCDAETLATAGLPPLKEMSPMLLGAWLSLLQRSGLKSDIESALLGALSGGTNTRVVSITAGCYADIAPVADVISVFESLPFEAQLSVLDSWWIHPREPKVVQPFLIGLLGHKRPGIRVEAAKSLAQYHAAGSAAALLKTAVNDPEAASAALDGLVLMSDLLTPGQIGKLAALLPDAGLDTRPQLVETLIRAGRPDALKSLRDAWRKLLPRNELPMAIRVLAMQPETAVGAYAATRTLGRCLAPDYRTLDDYLVATLDNHDLEMTRALLALDDARGFKLLRAIAQDTSDPGRLDAMCALARAGHDGDLIAGWLKGMAGEIKDPLGASIGAAVAMSTSDAAEEFKRNALQQGSNARSLRWVLISVMNGRSKSVTRDELYKVLFDTPQNAQRFISYWQLLKDPLPPQAARNLATAMAFSKEGQLLSEVGVTLMLSDAGVDMLSVLYGDAKDPAPGNQTQMYATALLGDPARAKAIIAKTPLQEDGSNYVGLMRARAWLGLLKGDANDRVNAAFGSDPQGIFGAVLHLKRAHDGDADALRDMLDALGPQSIRFSRGASAGASLVQQRWGSPYMQTSGVADAGYVPQGNPVRLAPAQLQPLFEKPVDEAWRDWWLARRALLRFNPETGKYSFTELP